MHIWLDPDLYQQEGFFRYSFSAHSPMSNDCELEPDGAHHLYHKTDVLSCTLSAFIVDSNGRLGRGYVFECDDDCFYTIRHPHHKIMHSPHALQERLMSFWNHELHCSPDLYLARYDDTHWLACNPIQQGIVAVLDEAARDLLETFRSVRSLKSLAEQWINETKYTRTQQSGLSIPQMVMLFVDLGLLIDTCQDPNSIPALPQYKSRILSAWLHVTNACNMGCSYCYIAKSTEHMTNDVGMRSVDAVIRSALHYNYQRVHLKYAGGEALLRWPQILTLHDYAVQQAQQHGLLLSATVLSNGTTLTPDIIQQLQQRHINVMISLDGIGSDHDTQRPLSNGKGSFHLVQRAIAYLLEHNLVPHINVTVSQRNLAGLPDLVAYLLEYNLPFFFSYYRENDCSATLADLQFSAEQMIAGMGTVFTYIQNHLPPRKIYGSLIDRANLAAPHHHTCSAGRDYLVIDQHGNITKCQTEIYQTITTIHADNPLGDLRSYQQGPQVVDVDAKEGCRACNWRYWCGGGCAVVTYRFTGRNDVRSPNCSIYKALFPEALRLEALRLLKYTSPL